MEMLFRQFDRAQLRLIPSLHFTTPLPELEVLRASGEDITGIEPIGPEGKATIEAGTRRGQGQYYNPLDPRVQRAIEDVVREVTARYAQHPSFGGLAIQLGPESY